MVASNGTIGIENVGIEKVEIETIKNLNNAAQSAANLTALWPLTEARHLDNDAKYAENLEVRSMRAIARMLTNLDVTVPDAEFVYEGADEIPGRPQEIVDALLSAADAYDAMDSCYEPNYDEAEAEILENDVNNIETIFNKLYSHASVDADAINSAADTLGVQGNWVAEDLQNAIEYAKKQSFEYRESVESQKIILVLCILIKLVSKTSDIKETLPIFLYINEVCECAGVPRMMFKDTQWRELVDYVRNSQVDCNESNESNESNENSISALINFAAPLLAAEWQKHREDVLWDPEVAKKLAKEEDDRKSREALAAKFAHVEGNKESTQALD
ncbi:hypothetical protein [Gardnerella greenwoodii]|uniref:Uncharacterized protein n=1 Tax=Gardnerella greenwoodii TaxID=2914925 RepID=A0A2N6RYX7_9BIFI|nr:hypothetical protein [Gardnerella greenwoodii]MDF0754131.1 hypothetical protein [Gardnerella greenwoodii]PMC43327.1 hypothetical protein CJ216_04520 [Gardnerella greenwoodii]